MTSWVLSIAEGLDDHWEYAKADQFWDLRTRRPIAQGDTVYFWQAPGRGFAGYGVVAEITKPDLDDAPWEDVAGQTFEQRILFSEIADAAPRRVTWGEVKQLTGFTQSPNFAPKTSDSAVEDRLAQLVGNVDAISDSRAIDILHDPASSSMRSDHRDVVLAAIRVRRGQQAFRRKLLTAYGATCAVTGTQSEQVLEAAHILPYRGDHTNVTSNGLLMRADIHTLFDLQKLTIEVTSGGNHHTRVDPEVSDPVYQALNGQRLRSLPSAPSERPSVEYLREHQAGCTWFTTR